MAHLKIDNLAPKFSLKNQFDEEIKLEQFIGKNIVIYFYPKASTPGCTVQACGMRDRAEEFLKSNTIILGVSPDSPAKLRKFIDKYNLNFQLLSDENHATAEAYGVWGLKKFMGREFMGIIRTTFIIDFEGKLRHIIEKVNTKTHDEEVLKYIKTNL